MRDQFAPVIEGFDCDRIVSPWSFQCESFYEDGGNGGTMLDGSVIEDVLAVKNRFSWALNVLTITQYNALISALNSGREPDTVSAIVFDPATDTRYATMFHVTTPAFRLVLDISGATVAIADSPLVLEETGDEKTLIIAYGDYWKLLEDGTLIIDIPPGKTPEEIWPDILREIAPYINDIIRIIITDGTPLPSEIMEELIGMLPNLEDIILPPSINTEEIEEIIAGLTVIQIVSYPAKSDYLVNDTLNYAGLQVVKKSHGTLEYITDKCALVPAEGTTVTETGNIIVDVRYHDKSLGTFKLVARGVIASDDDWTLYNDGTLEIDPLPDGSPETEGDRWTRILEDLDNPSGDPGNLIHDVDRIVLEPNIPSLPSGIPERFPNLDEIVIPPNVEILPDEFDNLTIIKIVSFPRKSDYVVGNPLDYNGLRVVEISGDTERDITPECVLRPADGYVTTEAGYIMVDVRYHDKSLGTFWVSVVEAEIIDGGEWWTLSNNGLLDVYCVGDMPLIIDPPNNDVPWYEYNRQITDVTIRDSVTDILSHSFENCVNLTNIIIPDSITIIGSSAFAKSGLTSVTIPNSVTFINGNSFMSCKSLVSATLSSGMTWIDEQLFYECSNLAYVTIPDSVKRILRSAFSQCDSLTDIYYSGTEEQWNTITIEGGNTPLLNATIHYNSSGPT